MKILLFDMDGVLLESRGYHLALQETIRRIAAALGFRDGTIPVDAIAAFEAGGITSEWDEAAVATAALLKAAWSEEPDLELPTSLANSPSYSKQSRALPDFESVAKTLATPELIELHPLERAARLFLNTGRHNPNQERILKDLILGARLAEDSLTHRTFQELVLGSAEFESTYGLAAELHCDSYLLKYDRSNLSTDESAALRNWMNSPGQTAAVITSRPSSPPEGVFSTPEAELGTKLVGLDGIPILGWGGMCWLGLQRLTNPQSFLKPSPVHALAAIRRATGESQENALTAAADLVDKKNNADWFQFNKAEVYIFEDTPGGVKSLLCAQAVLSEVGISIQACTCGITTHLVKSQALVDNGARVFPSLGQALQTVLFDG
jgi:hypothetical protein